MSKLRKKWLVTVSVIVLLSVLGLVAWYELAAPEDFQGIARANGRIETGEFDIAPKMPGRVQEILVREGEFVERGQVLAVIDTAALQAQRREAEAHVERARAEVTTAQSQLEQSESERAAAHALVNQRMAELDIAQKTAARSSALADEGAAPQQRADDDRARVHRADAAVSAARAQVAAADAAIATARSRVAAAESAVEAAQAAVERISEDIEDSTLKAPRDGRVQYRIAEPGEVLGAGAPLLNVVDLRDVYMTFFLPTAEAGRVAIGSQVRLVLDAAPQHVIPAEVSFVADVAQFTPRTVETEREREKLMFRIRAHIPEEILEEHIVELKPGLPGMAYVRLDPDVAWPDHLQVEEPS